MPYFDTRNMQTYGPDVIAIPITFSVSTGTVVSALKAGLPQPVTAVKAATGQVTVTFTDGPYYQCIGAHGTIIEGTPTTAGLVVKPSLPTDGTGTTSTVNIYTGADQATLVNPGTASTVSLTYYFKKKQVTSNG